MQEYEYFEKQMKAKDDAHRERCVRSGIDIQWVALGSCTSESEESKAESRRLDLPICRVLCRRTGRKRLKMANWP